MTAENGAGAVGDASELAGDDLDALAQITPDDVRRAAERWRQHAPAEFRDLLDAKPEKTTKPS